MLVSMFVFSSLLGLGFALLQALLKLEDQGVAHAEAAAVTGRLARIFRTDVHRASAVEAGDENARVQEVRLFGPGDRVVRYRMQRNSLVRVEQTGGEVRTNDAFRMPMGTAAFEVGDVDGIEIVTLVFDRRVTRRKRGDAREIRIDAVLGKDLRFAQETRP
jgi:hypothetical protein